MAQTAQVWVMTRSTRATEGAVEGVEAVAVLQRLAYAAVDSRLVARAVSMAAVLGLVCAVSPGVVAP
jgi:hypothetical protein